MTFGFGCCIPCFGPFFHTMIDHDQPPIRWPHQAGKHLDMFQVWRGPWGDFEIWIDVDAVDHESLKGFGRNFRRILDDGMGLLKVRMAPLQAPHPFQCLGLFGFFFLSRMRHRQLNHHFRSKISVYRRPV